MTMRRIAPRRIGAISAEPAAVRAAGAPLGALQTAAHRRRRARSPRGQAFAEFGFAAVLLGLMLAGVLEFGRAWGAVDTLQAAAREGARTASVTNPATRESAAITSIRTLAATHFDEDELDIDIAEGTLAGTQPVVTVTVTGDIDLIFAELLPIGTMVDGKRVIQITRSTTLPDEWVTAAP